MSQNINMEKIPKKLSVLDRRILISIVFCIFIIICAIIIITYTQTYNYNKNEETYLQNNDQYEIIYINDYDGNWNHLCELIVNIAEDTDNIIVECETEHLILIGNALTFMIENLSIPVIVTDNIKDAVKSISIHNNILPYNIMVSNGDKLIMPCTATTEENYIFGKEPPSRTIIDENNMKIRYVDSNIDITVLNSSDSIDLIESCTDSDALILNIKDKNHINQNLNEQLKYLSDNNMPSILINQLDGDLLIPSYKMTTESAYAKLAVIMSNLNDAKLIEPVFSKNLSNEFL
jgi:hypothetical protein